MGDYVDLEQASNQNLTLVQMFGEQRRNTRKKMYWEFDVRLINEDDLDRMSDILEFNIEHEDFKEE